MRILRNTSKFIAEQIKKFIFLFECKVESSKFLQLNIKTIDFYFPENFNSLKRTSKYFLSENNFLSEFFLKKILKNQIRPNNYIKFKILRNVCCFPGPSFNSKAIYLKKNNLLLSEGYDLKKEKLSLEYHYEDNKECKFQLNIKKNQFCISMLWLKDRKFKKYESGINLLDSVNNYWHFLFEQAPKILLAQNSKIPLDVPICIPKELHPNLYQIINILNSGEFKREIVRFNKFNPQYPLANKLFKFKKIYHIPIFLDAPIHSRDEVDLIKKISKGGGYVEVFKSSSKQKFTLNFNSYPIELLVTKVMSHFNFKQICDPNLKLILRRESSYRVSKDQKKLEDFLIGKGFQIFNPSVLSFKEQVQICSKASYFVGFSGAGCANCIFLPNEAKKIIFFNKTFMYLIPFWDALLSNASFLDNGFKNIDNCYDIIHGIPYLTKENWDFLRRNI